MIPVGETDPNELEVPFDLPDASNPLVPFGFAPTAGAVKLLLPGAGGWVDVAVDHQLVKGNGALAALLTTAQATTPGSGYIYAFVAGAQPFVDQFEIFDRTSYATDANQGELAFNIPDASNPLAPFAAGAYSFVLGDVMLVLPGGGWLQVPVAQIATKGFGAYAVRLTTPQKVTPGKAYLYANVAGAQPFVGEYSIGGSADGNPPVITVISPTPGVSPGVAGGFPADPTAARSTPIVLTVTDLAPGLEYFVVTARLFANNAATPLEEVVYRRGSFRGPYVASSSSVGITGGVQLTVQRAGGWPAGASPEAHITFAVDALDAAGNLAA